MGNHRFRFSQIMPNAWFHKLKDIGRTRNQNTNRHPRKKKHPPTTSSSSTETAFPEQKSETKQPHSHPLSHQRKSYYFTRELTPPKQPVTNPKATDTHFPDSPVKSSKQLNRASRTRPSPKLVTSTVSTGCRCGAMVESVWAKPDSTSEEYPNSPMFSSSEPESLLPELGSDHYHEPGFNSGCCRVEDDILNKKNVKSVNAGFQGIATISELELPPIITTKTAKCRVEVPEIEKKIDSSTDSTKSTSAKFEERNTDGSLSVKLVKEEKITACREQRTSLVRRVPGSSPRVRLRTKSPRIASRKIQGVSRRSVSSYREGRSLSESFAVVKSSADPQKDFRESMVEMIMENNIRASKDLEDLLACYLQLNSGEYHGLIIEVFKQIWFDYAHVRLK